MSGRVAAVLGLLAVWILALGSVKPGDLAVGLLLAVGVSLFVRHRVEPDRPSAPPFPARVAAFPVFLAGVVADVASGTWRTLLYVCGLRPEFEPGYVEVPIGERSRRGLAVSGLVETLSPGSLLVTIDHERGVMVFHELDVRDRDAVLERHLRAYERRQRKVFP